MRRATTLLTILASLLFYAFALATPASADPGGNNGDVKIHDTGTAVQDNRNEPHVCNFYIDGFNFDGGSSGSWRIEGWAPTGSGVKSSNSWGPADATGNWHSNPITLPDGHYKLFFKQTSPMTPGGEKQKVFWVDCNGTTTIGSSAATPAPTPTVAGFQQNNSASGAVTPAVALPGGSNQQSPNGAVNGVQTSPVAGVQGLPSTSTDSAPTIPLAALGIALMGLGGVLLRRRDTRA
jgi:LPXTG-motif cell wall-anchored protein